MFFVLISPSLATTLDRRFVGCRARLNSDNSILALWSDFISYLRISQCYCSNYLFLGLLNFLAGIVLFLTSEVKRSMLNSSKMLIA